MSAPEDERLERLAADIDARLLELWAMLWGGTHALTSTLDDEDAREALAQTMRHAYGQGYHDALLEDREGQRGALGLAHGYGTP